MKDIEDRIKEKYDEEKVPDYMFDTSRVFKRVDEEKKSKKKIISIAAGIVIIIAVTILLSIVIPNTIKNKEINIKEKSYGENIAGTITISNNSHKMSGYNQSTFIDSIIVNKIQCYKIIEGVPYTKVTATIINSYLGDLSGQIEIYVPGGIFSVEEILNNIQDIEELNKYNAKDLIQVKYYNNIYIPIAEKGKTYIATIIENHNQYYIDLDKGYGFKEYDPETNIVKDDTGDEELNIKRYLESMNT